MKMADIEYGCAMHTTIMEENDTFMEERSTFIESIPEIMSPDVFFAILVQFIIRKGID